MDHTIVSGFEHSLVILGLMKYTSEKETPEAVRLGGSQMAHCKKPKS